MDCDVRGGGDGRSKIIRFIRLGESLVLYKSFNTQNVSGFLRLLFLQLVSSISEAPPMYKIKINVNALD
jgi:hypothetical protein